MLCDSANSPKRGTADAHPKQRTAGSSPNLLKRVLTALPVALLATAGAHGLAAAPHTATALGNNGNNVPHYGNAYLAQPPPPLPRPLGPAAAGAIVHAQQQEYGPIKVEKKV